MSPVPALASLSTLAPLDAPAVVPLQSLPSVFTSDFFLLFLFALAITKAYEYAEERYGLAPYFLPVWGLASTGFGAYLLVVETGRVWARWLFLLAGLAAIGYWVHGRTIGENDAEAA